MTNTTYNGWKNHATWCVHLHISNTEYTQRNAEESAARCLRDAPKTSQATEGIWTTEQAARFTLADELKATIEASAESVTSTGVGFASLLVSDLVTAYLCNVDWNEIADAFLEGITA